MRKSKNQVKRKNAELHAKLDRNESEEIISTLEKNNELNSIHLKQRKTKKFVVLKLKPKNQYLSFRKRRNHSHRRKNKPTSQKVICSCIEKNLKKVAKIFDVNSVNKILQKTNQIHVFL